MNINSLPSLCLRMIFSQLPLRHVLQMGQVCPLWGEFQEEITSRQSSVVLLLGPQDPLSLVESSVFKISKMDQLVDEDGRLVDVPELGGTPENRLTFDAFDEDTLQMLLDAKLRNVTSLEIAISGLPLQVLSHIIRLLNRWSSKLTSLKLWCQFSCEDRFKPLNAAKVIDLLKCINKCPNLRHLTFELRHSLYNQYYSVNENFQGVKPHFNLPILGQLHEFFFSTEDPIQRTPLFYSLKNFARSNDQLRQIGIGNWDKHLMYSWFAFKCPSMGARLTHLPNVDWTANMELSEEPLQAQRRFADFGSLTEIYFDHFAHHMPFSQLINSFSGLRQLISLKLNLFLHDYRNASHPLSQDDGVQQDAICQLTSVKLLLLSLHASAHSHLDSQHWGWVFPNLQLLTLHHDCFPSPHKVTTSDCEDRDCQHYSGRQFGDISANERIDDTRKMLATFKQCAQLRKIVTHANYPSKFSNQWALIEVFGRRHILKIDM